jgi:hypothetical protein
MNVFGFLLLPKRDSAFKSLSLREAGLLTGLLLLSLVALVSPSLAYDTGLSFADARYWHGVPNAKDVFSNLPFKLLELADHMIFEATHQVISGHSLKHMVAALAALPVIAAIRSPAAQSAPVALT